MNLKDQLDALLDATAFDSTGAKIGAVRQVYVDDASGKITFATVSTGIFSADAIVPLHGARLLDDELHVDHTRAVIRDSPRPDDTEDALTPEKEAKLLEYYGIETSTRLRGTVAQSSGPAAGAAGEPAATTGAGASTESGARKDTGEDEPGRPASTPGGVAPAAGVRSGVAPAAGARGGVAPAAGARGGVATEKAGTARRDAAAPGAGEDAPADPTSARRDDKRATTTRSADGDTAAASPAPARASGPGPATPATDPSEETGGTGADPRRD